MIELFEQSICELKETNYEIKQFYYKLETKRNDVHTIIYQNEMLLRRRKIETVLNNLEKIVVIKTRLANDLNEKHKEGFCKLKTIDDTCLSKKILSPFFVHLRTRHNRMTNIVAETNELCKKTKELNRIIQHTMQAYTCLC